jgi:hypothetical protein
MEYGVAEVCDLECLILCVRDIGGDFRLYDLPWQELQDSIHSRLEQVAKCPIDLCSFREKIDPKVALQLKSTEIDHEQTPASCAAEAGV